MESDVSKGHSLEKDRLSLDMECLCQFLKVVGQHMDTEKARYLMDQYFERMCCILERGTSGQQNRPGNIKASDASSRPSKKKSAGNKFLPLDTRIRFMMKDIIELRQNHWVPRYTGQQAESNKPKLLSEIRKELEAKTGTVLEPSRSERSPAHRDVPGSGYHPSDDPANSGE
ncbi:Eukaryotic translation initiation factor 4 gamma 2 [Sparganum proliferum]